MLKYGFMSDNELNNFLNSVRINIIHYCQVELFLSITII